MVILASIFCSLALISIGSILVRRPWTIPLARRSTSPEVWTTDLFLETNMVITGAWAALFAGGAALALIAPPWIHLVYGALLFYLGHLSPKFGAWYSSRRLRAMGLVEPH